MTMTHKTEKVIWAEGRKHSEHGKYTYWSGSKEYAQLGGFTIEGSIHGKDVKLTAHTSHGLSYWKNFRIPLDNVEELCKTLMRVRDNTLRQINAMPQNVK